MYSPALRRPLVQPGTEMRSGSPSWLPDMAPAGLQTGRAGQNCLPTGSAFPARPGLQVLGCPSGQVYPGTFKRVRQHYMPVALSSQEDQGGCQGSLFLPVLLAQRSRKKKEKKKTQKKTKTPSKQFPEAMSSLTHISSCTSAHNTWPDINRPWHRAPKPR